MGNSRLRRFLPWIPAVPAVAMIGTESTAMMSSSDTSRWLLPIWERLFGRGRASHWAVIHFFIRKTGHLTGYGIVSLCFFYGWMKTIVLPGGGLRALWMRCALLAVPCAALVASADEFHQSFLASRTGSPVDAALDTSGAIVAQLIVLALLPLLVRKSSERLKASLVPGIE